jgi:hypothetical protein
MREPTDLHQQELDAEAQRQRDEFLRMQETEDLKWLMAHQAGRRIAWQLLARSGVFRNPFNNSGSVTAFNCGQMNLGQQLLAQILEHAPDAYVKMLKDQK